MTSIHEYLGNEQTAQQQTQQRTSSMIRVAMPGIITAFDTETQTATVQPTIRELVLQQDRTEQWTDIPLLQDVPVVMPRAGGFALTFPVQPGDECLVVFADMCIDAWWQSGDVQNQADKRRHDLSDAFAILGPWSQPRRIADLADRAVELRSEQGDVRVTVTDSDVTITTPAALMSVSEGGINGTVGAANVSIAENSIIGTIGNVSLSLSATQIELHQGQAEVRLSNGLLDLNGSTVRVNGVVISP